jgi:hypothetical protein
MITLKNKKYAMQHNIGTHHYDNGNVIEHSGKLTNYHRTKGILNYLKVIDPDFDYMKRYHVFTEDKLRYLTRLAIDQAVSETRKSYSDQLERQYTPEERRRINMQGGIGTSPRPEVKIDYDLAELLNLTLQGGELEYCFDGGEAEINQGRNG